MNATRKVVINTCFGGFGLSDEAQIIYATEKGLDMAEFSMYEIKRDDPVLVQVVEELGTKADGWASHLKVVEIPDDVEYTIEDYDGVEHIAEVHRTWC